MQTPPKSEDPKKPAAKAQPIPEMIGATEAPFVVEKDQTHISLVLHAPRGPALVRGPALPGVARTDGSTVRIILRVENITGTEMVPDLNLYLNLPKGEPADKHPELLAGRLPLFGLAESSSGEDGQTGNGLFHALDITAVYGRLLRDNDWDGKSLRVSFVPTLPNSSKVRVGRVSVYIA
ncbi:MAG TPA: hypothetical protein VFQ91_13305 [Bryobacteraceae bacterium]|nr:hypothetical protein [Bryobacteraceae bacterium]